MNEEKIISTIKMLAMSQGFYGRLYNQLMSAKEYDPDSYEAVIKDLSENCWDSCSLAMRIEG